MKHISRHLKQACALTVIGALVTVTPATATIRRVDASATGSNNGTTWGNAFTDLQTAVDISSLGDEIWVAAGAYTPSAEFCVDCGSPGARHVTFLLKNGVAIYGGFLGNAAGGGETDLDQRNPEQNETILSGEIGDPNSTADNAAHVITAFEVGDGTILNGFTITGGVATVGSTPDDRGAGMLVVGLTAPSSPKIVRCRFVNNVASGPGGGLAIYENPSYPTTDPVRVVNCEFIANESGGGGAGANVINADFVFTNCVFRDNSAGSFGGAMWIITELAGVITNCTFAGNTGVTSGGAMTVAVISPGVVTVSNSVIWDNNPSSNQITGASAVNYSDLEGGWSGSGAGNLNTDPQFCDALNGDFRLSAGSPVIDAGEDDEVPADEADVDDDGDAGEDLPWDILKSPRVVNADSGSDDVDMGAYEHPTTLGCPADLDRDNDVDLSDLAILLACFGSSDCQSESCCLADFTCDSDVDLEDMAILLGAYGETCGFTGAEGDFDLLITPYNTSGYSGGGFAGEDDHFVFDLLIDVDEEDDDWTAAGLCVARANGAVFRLVADPNDPPVPGAGEPDKYTTFFSVPKSVNDSARFTNPFPTGGVAGSCHPLSGAAVYTTTSVHACWLDWDVDSADGPAAIARVVLDVSGVSGSDTSGGYGSVYFSTTGPANMADIKVADLHASAAHKYAGGEMSELEGAFYVVGQ